VAGCGAVTETTMNELKIPYSPKEVGHCYDRLKQTMPVYQNGISAIRSEIESQNSFDQRLKKVLSLLNSTVQEGQTRESSNSWNEDDVFRCCFYDMLEAMYAAEAERITSEQGTSADKMKNLDALAASIAKLPFGSPQYESGIRPRLEKAVSEHRKDLN
jgi:hypothetical protein